jgi:hypothetical protein
MRSAPVVERDTVLVEKVPAGVLPLCTGGLAGPPAKNAAEALRPRLSASIRRSGPAAVYWGGRGMADE